MSKVEVSKSGLCYKPKAKLNSVFFEKYLSFSRVIGVYDPDTKSWCLSPIKLQHVDPLLLKRLYEEVKIIDQLIGFEPEDAWVKVKEAVEQRLKVIPSDFMLGSSEAKISGNEVFMNDDSVDYDVVNSVLCKDVRRFDYRSRSYITEKVCFYRVVNNILYFYRGLFPAVQEALKKAFYNVTLSNPYNPELEKLNISAQISKFTLRSYQIDAIKNALKYMAQVGGALLQLPTGAGKTVIGASLLKLLRDAGFVQKCFVVVNSKTLAVQWSKFLNDFGFDVGLWTGDEKNLDQVTVTTFQSIYNSYNKVAKEAINLIGDGLVSQFKDADFVIFDEVHHIPANTFKAVASLNSKLHLGLSATPYREDSLDEVIYGLTSTPAFKMYFSDLLEFLIAPTVINVQIPLRLSEGREYMMRFNDANEEVYELDEDEEEGYGSKKVEGYIDYMKYVLWNPRIWQYALWLADKFPKPVLIHSPLEKPAYHFSTQFKLPLLSGKLSDTERKVILEGLNSRNISIAVTTTVVDEGIDIPALRGLIMLFPGGSRVKLIQRIGRLVRRASGKSNAYAFIFNYVTESLWFNNILAKQKLKRDKAIGEEREWRLIDVGYKDVLSVLNG
ncbi:putative superfamily 2 helicase [Sulfolobales Beppu filamentous virus 2]|uniref:Putative superfamily 2 helicase n=1 Tax=Sulfolobales Beppu filamentous virus 2 TaxID=2493123 RepID=A0A3S8NEV2_9VIRU|nr:DNA helicase [Sulfolobales Beppu filamentous virus 2]AZI75768.1 putative superfamily 2 helicase [Sulfolobales Beppu filamentous virus 2]